MGRMHTEIKHPCALPRSLQLTSLELARTYLPEQAFIALFPRLRRLQRLSLTGTLSNPFFV